MWSQYNVQKTRRHRIKEQLKVSSRYEMITKDKGHT